MKRKKQQNKPNKKQCTDDAKPSAPAVVMGVRTRSMTRMKINELNDYCLLEIFSYLSKRQLVKIETVCKKWKDLSSQVWAKETTLNVEKIFKLTEKKRQCRFVRKGLNIKDLENILKKCGQFLKSIDLNCSDSNEWAHKCNTDDIVNLLSQYCENLKEVSLLCGRLSDEGFKILKNNIINENLESLDLSGCYLIDNKQLEEILKKGKNINKLILHPADKIKGEYLINSGRAFKKLGIESYFNRMDTSDLEKILKNSPELEYYEGSKECTFKILNVFPFREHLTHLVIHSGQFFKDFPESALPFPNLRFLDLMGDHSVENQILSEFYKLFPNLETLDISECNYNLDESKFFDNDGIKELGKLSKLKSLNVNSLWFLKADSLVDIAIKTDGRIERLDCHFCNKLRDPDMIKFVSLCPNLTYLDVSYEQRITDFFLDEVIKLLPLRATKKPLTIRITHSYVCNLIKYEKKHFPMLEIEDYGELDEAHFDYDESEYEEDEDEYLVLEDYESDN